jgi:hypothetical protein
MSPLTSGSNDDFRKYADLEHYLFEEVGPAFRKTKAIKPEDFLAILIWKANRAKNRHLKRIRKIEAGNFRKAVRQIARDLTAARSAEQRLYVLMAKWKFRLPSAAAVLSVFYPDEFSVYDYRVCDELIRLNKLNDFKQITNLSPKSVWPKYRSFLQAVFESTPASLTLRDRDRYLWGKSIWRGIEKDCRASLRASEECVASDEEHIGALAIEI